MSGTKIKIAIPVGDPAGIGPEIASRPCSIRRCARSAIRSWCAIPDLLERHAKACGSNGSMSTFCPVRNRKTASLGFGVRQPVAGRASIAFCAAAVKAAMTGDVDAVVAAPQHETSIAQAGITFDGHPSFVARQTGTDESGVYMMLCFGDTRIAHCTLHRSVREAHRADHERERRAHDPRRGRARFKRLGIASPKIAVSGLNPHAGEGGLFGREEIEIIKPAMDTVAAEGIEGRGPVRRRHHVPHAGLRRLRRHAARPGPHRDEAFGAERRGGAHHRHADPVCVGGARHRPRHRRPRRRQSGGDDRGGAANGEGGANECRPREGGTSNTGFADLDAASRA